MKDRQESRRPPAVVAGTFALVLMGTLPTRADEPGPALPYLVKDLQTATLDSSPAQFVTLGSAIYFTADPFTTNTGRGGRGLWKSDGTAGGTVELPVPISGNMPLRLHDLTPVGDRLFFLASDSGGNVAFVGVTDATPAGTTLLALPPEKMWFAAGHAVEYKGRLLFAAVPRRAGPRQWELWITDGTVAGTVPLPTTEEPLGFSGMRSPSLVWAGDFVYFPRKERKAAGSGAPTARPPARFG